MVHTSAKLALPASEWTPQWIASILPMNANEVLSLCYQFKLLINYAHNASGVKPMLQHMLSQLHTFATSDFDNYK